MSSSTEICNMALSHLGIGREIASFDEKSQEAAACRRFYETARQATLRDFPWPFATRYQTLALIKANPTIEWGFAYAYPSDCAKLMRIVSGNRNDTSATRVVYEVASFPEGRAILTDQATAQAQYTADISDTNLFQQDFVIALSYRLAALMAPRLTGGDAFKLGQAAFNSYLFAISRAEASAMNEIQQDLPPDSEFILARG